MKGRKAMSANHPHSSRYVRHLFHIPGLGISIDLGSSLVTHALAVDDLSHGKTYRLYTLTKG